VQGSHAYAQAGTYAIVVYINGPDGTSVCTKTGFVQVAPGQGPVIGLTPEGTPLTAIQGATSPALL